MTAHFDRLAPRRGASPSVVHTTDALAATGGGPPRTISALATGLGRQGARVTAVAFEGVPGEAVITPDSAVANTTLVPRGLGDGERYRAAILAVAPEIVHDHGIWLRSNRLSARVSAQAGLPRVVTTRGMLEPWALAHHQWRKRVAWHLFQKAHLRAASVLHATAESEAEALRALGFTQPIAVIPNGVSLPAMTAPHDGRRRRALFLSRIHPKKGLPLLLDAWAEVRPEGWELVIGGPDEGGHQEVLEAQVARLGLGAVRFVGSVPDRDKWDLYRTADLFVLPTYSENFGVVVAEALAAGLPVLTTTGAPWAELEARRCGWWVAPEVRPIRDALAEAVSLPSEERQAMGERGRALVRDRYDWGAIAAQMLEVYAWVLDRRSRPPETLRQL